jgi:uncharacterized membrane protein
MAGIGFVLRRLARRDTLGSKLHGYVHGAFVACGPWLSTVLALGSVELLGRRIVGPEELARFSVVVIYNFCFSLVLAGPIVMVITRLLSDDIRARRVEGVPGMLIGALTLLWATQALVAVPFYGFAVDLAPLERVVSVIGFLLIGGIWLVAVFLSALKSFGTISLAFVLGMAAAFGAAALLVEPFGGLGAATGFSGGLALIFFILVARVFAEYPYPVARPFSFLSGFATYWEFAVVGLVYNAAIWADKWVMWLSPGGTTVAGAMPVYPAYDGAMFLAYLSIVPAMAVFVVVIETRFFEVYLRFYDDIGNHATLEEIHRNHALLSRTLRENIRNITILQIAVCYLTILVAPSLIDIARGGYEMVPIFRFGTIGAAFHALLLFTMVTMSYFDLRRELLVVSVAFLVLNTGLTLVTLRLGPDFYGYGYFLACLLSAILAYAVSAFTVTRLPYVTFVAHNRAIE